MPDATSLHSCLNNKQLKLNPFSGKDLVKGVFGRASQPHTGLSNKISRDISESALSI